MELKIWALCIFIAGFSFTQCLADLNEDKQALLDFIRYIPYSRPPNWDKNYPVCGNWTGVTCNADQTRVIALRLPGMGINGTIPSYTLSRLSALQVLSLRSNALSGPFPSEIFKLGNLTALYLQCNNFSGPLPDNFTALGNLAVLNLSYNQFNGSIASIVWNLTRLITLDVSYNSFSGRIPDVGITSLRYVNVSYNNLSGVLPFSYLRFPSSAFLGNSIYCYEGVSPVPSALPPSEAKIRSNSRHLGETALLGIIVGACVLGFVVVAAAMVCCSNLEGDKANVAKTKMETEISFKTSKTSDSQEVNGRITFFASSNLTFDLEDLLRASAEVLGKGMFGTTYKASLEDSTTVVVKRLKEVNVGKREFEQQMGIVGKIKHENVAPLRAYYYSKDEKLMVYDYFELGSISTMLHGKRGESRRQLDWETRLRIVIGVARGIGHIHSQNSGKLVHGNIKSSNVFLNSQQYGSISDLGLATIVTPVTPPIPRAQGYQAPEITDPRKSSQASDVYSFGVLLLELLTGKSPIGEGMNLVKWIYSVVREEWTAEVFDVELQRYPNIEEQMVEMLQVGMASAARVPDQRPKMKDIVRMVEDIGRGGTGKCPSVEGISGASTPTGATSNVVGNGSASDQTQE